MKREHPDAGSGARRSWHGDSLGHGFRRHSRQRRGLHHQHSGVSMVSRASELPSALARDLNWRREDAFLGLRCSRAARRRERGCIPASPRIHGHSRRRRRVFPRVPPHITGGKRKRNTHTHTRKKKKKKERKPARLRGMTRSLCAATLSTLGMRLSSGRDAVGDSAAGRTAAAVLLMSQNMGSSHDKWFYTSLTP